VARPVARPTARMSDAKLFRLAKRQKVAKEAVATAEAEAKALSQQIIPELQARGTKAIEGSGVRVNMVSGSYTSYDLEEMKAILGPRRYKRVTKVVVNTDEMKAAIDDGTITARELAQFATTTDKAPYILVSYVAD
jgi:hypothetical protein